MGKRPLRTTRRLANLHQGGHAWYRIQNQAAGPTVVYLMDEIGWFGVSAQDFVSELAGIDGDVEMHINCPGGDVFDGIAIYNTLRQRKGTVAVVIDGIAASAASFIAQAASPGQLAMAPHAQMMIHDGFGMAIGNAADMREMADLLDQASDNIAGIYADRTGKAASYWRDAMKTETWYTDQSAVTEGLADKILGQEAPTDKWDLSVYAHMPADDSGSWDPDGDGDDDSTPDHDHWAADGTQLKSVPGHPMTPEEEEAAAASQSNRSRTQVLNWDAAAAYAKCKTAADYKSIAFEKNNDSADDTQAHYGLPHHNGPGQDPDKGGVQAALGRWNQTEDLKDKAGAKTHLDAHASTLGLPSGDDSGGGGTSDVSDEDILAMFATELDQLDAGKE